MRCYLLAPGDCIESNTDIPMLQIFDRNQPRPDHLYQNGFSGKYLM